MVKDYDKKIVENKVIEGTKELAKFLNIDEVPHEVVHTMSQATIACVMKDFYKDLGKGAKYIKRKVDSYVMDKVAKVGRIAAKESVENILAKRDELQAEGKYTDACFLLYGRIIRRINIIAQK